MTENSTNPKDDAIHRIPLELTQGFHIIHVSPACQFTAGNFITTEEEMEKTNQRISKSTASNRWIMTDSMTAAERLWLD